jgi:hypothetical protein
VASKHCNSTDLAVLLICSDIACGAELVMVDALTMILPTVSQAKEAVAWSTVSLLLGQLSKLLVSKQPRCLR